MNESVDRKLFVLVVDEQQEVLDRIASALAAASFVCHCCTTAEDALAAAGSAAPDLIIADVNLHGQSGFHMCEQIKQREAALANVPVMFLSRTQIPDIIRRSDAAGSTYHLRKPLDIDVLVELVDQALLSRATAG